MPSEAQNSVSTKTELSCSAQYFYRSDDNVSGVEIPHEVISVVHASMKWKKMSTRYKILQARKIAL